MTATAAQIHIRHTGLEGLDVDFSVEQLFNACHTRTTRALRVSENDLTVERMPDDGAVEFMWLKFRLPGTNESMRALGQFDSSSEYEGETRIRFKHMWPETREMLERYLAANV